MTTEPEVLQESSLRDDLAADLALTEEPAEIEAVSAEPPLEPAPKWDKLYKEVFQEWSGLPKGRDYQKAMLDLYGEQQGYATKVEQERAELRQRWEQAQPFVSRMQEALSPYQQFLAESGATPDMAVRQSLGLLMQLRANPQQTLTDLAKRMGVSLQPQEEVWKSPEAVQVEELRNELNRMRQDSQMREQYAMRQRMEAIQHENASQIEAFKSAKDDNGEPLHPHMGAVEDTMAQLIFGRENLRRVNPQLPPMMLEEAYSQACKLSDEIAQDSAKKADADRLAKASADAKKAGDAAKRVKKGSSGTEPSRKSLRDDIAESLRSSEAA